MGSANSAAVGRNSGASGRDLSHGGTSSPCADGMAASPPSISRPGGANRAFGRSRGGGGGLSVGGFGEGNERERDGGE